MKRTLTAALTATTLLMTTAAVADEDVQKVQVAVDTAAIENLKGAVVWKNVALDLNAAIVERLGDQLDQDGARVMIDIDTVALANSLEEALNIADAKLAGDVNIFVPGMQNDEVYSLSVSAEQASAFYPEGTDSELVTVSSEVFYRAMIDGFADNVASRLN
ncbi:hypothetical protein [Amylibacter sp. IMCC11727]|uniref:hypothetical protein n=1 Tax=Amylibacter sp. IMCC11727 TaxID=3039851 RepID=UPI00244DDBDE|nr:hypothetical protein [Amylibacter sp. IMCC11727]WGI23179.1 hypothetical protein QBD29_07090 [Amylibacter sp. IMCC11727]